MENDTELELDELVGAVEEEPKLMLEPDDEDEVPAVIALEDELEIGLAAEDALVDGIEELEVVGLEDEAEL